MAYYEFTNTKDLNDDAKIWRYMSLEKFLSLIQDRKLYFTRLDKFEDPYEGVPYKFQSSYEAYEEINSLKSVYPSIFEDNKLRERLKLVEDIKRGLWKLRRTHYVNCWHINESESLLMWKYYGNRGSSVAIQSTYGKLKESITNSEVFIRKVIYSDKHHIQDGKGESSFLIKRPIFKEENELRAVYRGKKSDKAEMGVKIDVDLKKLIDNIILSPILPSWEFDSIKKVIEMYNNENSFVNINTDLVQSNILNSKFQW